jgi:hypothetical protein
MGKYMAGWLTAGMISVLLGGCRSAGGGCSSGSCPARSPSTDAAPNTSPGYVPPAAAPTYVPPSTSPGYIPPTGGGRITEGSGSR